MFWHRHKLPSLGSSVDALLACDLFLTVADTLLVITGAPASGKTTIARPLTAAVRIVLLEKDAIKEVLFDSLGDLGSGRLSDASFQVLFTVAGRLRTAAIEGNFRPEHESRIASLATNLVQIHVRCSPGTARKRYLGRARSRHPAHPPSPTEGSFAAAPLRLQGPLLEVSGEEEIDLQALAGWVRQKLGRP